jgi:hypothetical protein
LDRCGNIRQGVSHNSSAVLSASYGEELESHYLAGLVPQAEVMVSKCANPGCSTPFRYLHEGKLFRSETDVPVPGLSYSEAGDFTAARARRIEFFWLCEKCAAAMTLTFRKDVGVTTQPRAKAHRAGL